jgi:hypothetical protein
MSWMKNQLEYSTFVVKITAINGDYLEKEIKIEVKASSHKEAEILAMTKIIDKATTYNIWSITTSDVEELCNSVTCYENCDGCCSKCIKQTQEES